MNIKQLRNEKGLTGPKMAKMLNVSVPHYYDMENGKKRIHGEMLSNIADILETSTDYLLGRTEDPAPPGKKTADYEAMVFQEKTASDAVIRTMDIYSRYHLPKDWLIDIWEKIIEIYL